MGWWRGVVWAAWSDAEANKAAQAVANATSRKVMTIPPWNGARSLEGCDGGVVVWVCNS